MLQANHGDCFLISHTNGNKVFNILIDGGNKTTFSHGPHQRYSGELRILLDELKRKDQYIDLLILTHFDDDHIGGLIRGYETRGYLQEMVKRVWFNSSLAITDYFEHTKIVENEISISSSAAQTTAEQGSTLEKLLMKTECELLPIQTAGEKLECGPFTFKILSPTKECLKKLLCIWPKEKSDGETSGSENDYHLTFDELQSEDNFEEDTSLSNESSIAFIIEAEEKKMLFLGDAHNNIIIKSLRELGYSEDFKLDVEFFKISHHASKYNTSLELLNMIDAKKYLISSNGVKKGAVSKKTISRIMKSSKDGVVFFNYKEVVDRIIFKEKNKDFYSEKLIGFSKSQEFLV